MYEIGDKKTTLIKSSENCGLYIRLKLLNESIQSINKNNTIVNLLFRTQVTRTLIKE